MSKGIHFNTFSSVSCIFGVSGISGRFSLLGAALAISTMLPIALATPVLPSSAVASQAVKAALAQPKVAQPKAAAAAPAKKATTDAAATRARAVSQASARSVPRSSGRSAIVHSTAYNSTPGQTDSSPYITATGTRVRSGVVALSRDLLRRFPYGTRVTIEDMSGRYNSFLRGRVFVVEDTMNVRIGNTVDVWMNSRREAMSWGSRNIRITAVQ
jgi:3D (Asp-Asp-Asp) domain-containing protein